MAAAGKHSKAYLTTAALYWQQLTQAEQQQVNCWRRVIFGQKPLLSLLFLKKLDQCYK
jgi:hypothetical protein